MAYVGSARTPSGCVFCQAFANPDDRAGLVLQRSERAFLILNAFPYTPGHLMAAVTRHVGTLAEATPEELAAAMGLAALATRALAAEYRAEGFNIGINQGRIAGAGIEDHLHIHVVPRWGGDTNFMPVLGDTRVLPESLEATWDRLKGRLVG